MVQLLLVVAVTATAAAAAASSQAAGRAGRACTAASATLRPITSTKTTRLNADGLVHGGELAHIRLELLVGHVAVVLRFASVCARGGVEVCTCEARHRVQAHGKFKWRRHTCTLHDRDAYDGSGGNDTRCNVGA